MKTTKETPVKQFHFHEDCTLGPWRLDETWMTIVGPNGEEVCAIHSGQPSEQRVNRTVAHDNGEMIARLPTLFLEHADRGLELMRINTNNERLRNALEITVATLSRLASTQAKSESIKGTLDVAREAMKGGGQ